MSIQEKIYMWTIIVKGLNYDKDIEKLKNKLQEKEIKLAFYKGFYDSTNHCHYFRKVIWILNSFFEYR